MSQQFQSSQCYPAWRGGRGERVWLALLVHAMEKASQQPEPCDGEALAALRAQLALPATSRFVRPINLLN